MTDILLTAQPDMARRAGRTTRLKVTMLLTGLPGSPNTTNPLPELPGAAPSVANVSGLPGFIFTCSRKTSRTLSARHHSISQLPLQRTLCAEV